MSDRISSIGSYGGLGAAGLYGSYYDPSMMMAMGGYGSYGMTNPMMMGGYGMGMMGAMYNPTFMGQYTDMMKQMYSAQNEIQKLQIQNASNLHAEKERAQVYNANVHDRAFFETVAVNGDVQKGIREIYDAIRKGDSDYVAQKYYELKQVIFNKYSDHFSNPANGLNEKENIDHYISTLYSEIAGGYNPGAPKPDLRTDILTYGETPFEHGMNTTFLGNSGHNKLNAEECLNKIYGTNINDAGSKAKAEEIGQWAGRAKEGAMAAGLGAVGGMTLVGFGRLTPVKFISNIFKGKFKAGAWLGAIGLGIVDTLWQMGRS